MDIKCCAEQGGGTGGDEELVRGRRYRVLSVTTNCKGVALSAERLYKVA